VQTGATSESAYTVNFLDSSSIKRTYASHIEPIWQDDSPILPSHFAFTKRKKNANTKNNKGVRYSGRHMEKIFSSEWLYKSLILPMWGFSFSKQAHQMQHSRRPAPNSWNRENLGTRFVLYIRPQIVHFMFSNLQFLPFILHISSFLLHLHGFSLT
jgi:hypothetical protein